MYYKELKQEEIDAKEDGTNERRVKGSFKCKACSQNVTGFYYNCGQCGFCYHILCSALPLSTSVKTHSHPLELEFSLPESNELMQLVAQGIARGINQETVNVAIVTGWDEKLCSRSEKLKIKNGMIEFSGKIQTKQDMEHVDQLSTLSSCQFSDSYFSIDLAKSYSSYNHQPNQESSAINRREANVVQDVEQKTSYRNDSVLDRIAENLEPAAAKEELRKPSFGFHYGPEYKINEAFLKEAGIDANENRNNNKMKKKNEPKDRSSIKNQSSISDTVSSTSYTIFPCFLF
ncbi:hypothetical protein CUMW_003590 [Citrus unshiu]|nr:hypothetical protein CUMW_003590 [Citrus unshiu]